MQLGDIRGVGPQRLAQLKSAGITDMEEVLAHLPRGYFGLRKPVRLSEVEVGPVCFVAEVAGVSERRHGRLSVVTARVKDGYGVAECTFFNQPYRRQSLKQGTQYLFYGMAEARFGRIQINTPFVEDPSVLEEAPFLPVYSPIKGVPQKTFRSIVRTCLDARELNADPLPMALRKEYGLCERNFALENIHFPRDESARDNAARRLSFEEMLYFHLALRALRERTLKAGIAHDFPQAEIESAIARLPYPLTGAQARVLAEVLEDLRAPRPMQRLIQGDVGSGKTVLALLSLYAAILSGYQGALMAPTEILARQHYDSAVELLEPLGVRVGLLTGGLPAAKRRQALGSIEAGEWQLVIGTHALIQKDVRFSALGLVVADEQHRFGVEQRRMLSEKGGEPDVLIMSATPIPRTLSLILYGDLDLSIIDEMPPGRTPVKTYRVPPEKRQDMLGFIQKQAELGRQTYVVCPLVEESEAVDAPSAQEVARALASALPKLNVDLVHGRMKAADKEAVIARFASGASDVLVSTTVIEVGVNVPNATVMVIEGAERFGLAQLHQLRGRVGRGQAESFCFLMTEGAENIQRLEIMTRTNDGFAIAEEDLKQRGPGEFLGTRQHGTLRFEFSRLADDIKILEEASKAAERLLSDPVWQRDLWPQMAQAAQYWAEKLSHIALN